MKPFATCLLTLLSAYAFGQGTVDISKGLNPFGVYGGGSIDHVNLENGNVYLDIPLLSFPQRGNDLRLNFDIRYNDKQWRISYTGGNNGGVCPVGSWTFDNGSGDIGVDVARDQVLTIGDVDSVTYEYSTGGGNPSTDYMNVTSEFVVTPDGARHYYGDIAQGNVDLENVSTLQPTIDGTGYYPEGPRGPFIGRDGVQYFQGGSIQDANGNQITTTSTGWIDSVGRQVPGSSTGPGTGPTHFWGDLLPGVQGSTSICQAGTASARVWTVPAVGGSATYYLCYSNFSYQTAFNAQNLSGSGKYLFGCVTEANGTVQLLSQIVLPNGTSYTFSYDSYLSLARLGLPTGGSISYTWQNLALTWTGGGPTYAPISRGLATRSVNANDGTGAKTSHYQWVASTSPCCWKHIVTDPAGNDQVETVGGVNLDPLVDLQTDSYQGCSPGNTLYCAGSGTLLKTVARSNFVQMGGILDYGATAPGQSYVPGTTTTSVPIAGTGQSMVSQVVDSYVPTSATITTYNVQDEGYIKGEYKAQLWTPSNVGYGQMRSRTYYDYGTTSAGSPLRTETTHYFYEDHPLYGNGTGGTYPPFYGGDAPFSNLLDLPESIVTTDGSGTFAAETDYSYDSGGCATTTSGATQHVTPPNAECGNLTTLTRVLKGGTNPVTKTAWNDAGEPVSTTDPRLNTTTFSYGQCDGSVRTQTTDALTHYVKGSYDCNTGLLTSFTDQNNQPTTYAYDAMDRLTGATFADGGKTTYCNTDTGGSTCTKSGPPYEIVTTKAISSINETQTTVYDGLARVSQTQLNSDSPSTTYTLTTYDVLGRKFQIYNPTRCSTITTNCGETTWGVTTYNYDPLSRITSVVEQDNSTISTSYTGNCNTVTDEAGNQRKSCSDGLGRLTGLWEAPNLTSTYNYETDYTYDTLNNLLSVNQKGGSTSSANWRTRTFTYNSLSQLLCAANPELQIVTCPTSATGTFPAGAITYGYDANGNLTSKTAPLPNQATLSTTVTTSYTYDALNRLTKKSYMDGSTQDPYTPTVQFGYDATALTNCTTAPPALTDNYPKGRQTAMCDGSGATSWAHDTMGRVLEDLRKIGPASTTAKSVTYAYNKDGSLASLVTPPLKTLTYTIGGAGRTTQLVDSGDIINFATNATYAPRGELAGVTLGSVASGFAGFAVSNAYNMRLQPIFLSAVSPATTVFGECFDFHLGVAITTPLPCSFSASTLGDNGNVYQIVNTRNNTRTQTFTYDPLNRIASGRSSGTQWGETFTLDAWGNLTNETGISGKMFGGGLNTPAGTNNRLTGFAYDAAGNMTGNGSTSYVYDAENRLVWTSAGYRYNYDGEGQRVEKCLASGATTATPCPTSGTTGTLYWRGTGSDTLDETDLGGNPQEEYIFFNGQRIARRDVSSTGATIAVHYYFSDHLGSSAVVESATGTTCEQDIDYYPYGGEESDYCPNVAQHYKFTGKERDAESGLDSFGRRHYAPAMGRWMSPDPLNLTSARLVNPTNTLNKYVYGGNNPLKYIDRDGEDITIFYRPSGLSPTDFGHIFIGALNQNTGQVGFLDFYPQGGGNGPGQFNAGNMQDRAATSDQFATLTIRTTPEQAQKVLDLITALKSGTAPDYAVLSKNCATICQDVLHDLGLDFGDVFPDQYWSHVYGNFSPAALDNPFKNFFVPRKTGIDYGNPRNYGVNFTQLLFQLYLNQWNSRRNNQQQKHKQRACVTAGGETTCEDSSDNSVY